MRTTNIIEFFAPMVPARIDEENGLIKGVSLITGGVTAKGHDLDVDDETLNQILNLAQIMGKVPVKCDHGAGVMHVCGHLTNFRREGNKVVGDWKVLKKFSGYGQIMETAEEQPETVGLSVSFVGPDQPFVGVDGRKKARATELLSTDYVIHPAANPTGLFSRKFASSVGARKKAIGSFNRRMKHRFDHRRPGATAGGVSAVAPFHLKAIGEAVELVRGGGPVQRPERATGSTSQTTTSNKQRRTADGQFTGDSKSSPEKMRLAYKSPSARLRKTAWVLRQQRESSKLSNS